MITELDRLAAARPPLPAEPSQVMSVADRQQLFDAITATPRSIGVPGRQRPARVRRSGAWRRWPVAVGLAAVVVVALLIVELVTPSGSPGGADGAAAATLQRLADVAAGTAGPTVGPGQFGYSEISQTSYLSAGTSVEKYWQALDGDLWRQVVTSTGSAHPVGCYYYPPPPANPRYPEFNIATPALLKDLPTDPNSLNNYLGTHVQPEQGGAPLNELVLDAVVDLVTNPATSPTLRAAAVRVLALDTRRVSVVNGSRDARGRPATALTFSFDHLSSGPHATVENAPGQSETLYFDPSTAQLLQRDDAQNGNVGSTELVLARSVADSVPASLLACIAAKPPAPGPR